MHENKVCVVLTAGLMVSQKYIHQLPVQVMQYSSTLRTKPG